MKLQTFDGGLQTRLDDHLIDANAAVEYENVKNEGGSLAPAKDKVATGVLVDEYYYNYNGEWVSNADPTEYAELHGNLYSGGAIPQKYDGTTTSNLGIVAPADESTTVVTEVPKPISLDKTTLRGTGDLGITQQDGDPSNFITGLYSYRTLMYDNLGVQIGFVTTVYDLQPNAANALIIARPSVFFDSVATIEIYRLYLGIFRLITTMNSASTPYTDFPYDISGNVTQPGPLEQKGLEFGTTYRYALISEYTDFSSVPLEVTETLLNDGGFGSVPGGVTYGIALSNFDVPAASLATTKLYRDDNGTYRELATVVPDTTPLWDFEADISGLPAINVLPPAGLSGVYQYVVTFYNSLDGTESQPSPITAETEVENGVITLTDIPVSTDPQVDLKRIYRVGGGLTTFALVAEIPNVDTTYIDATSDSDIPGFPLASSLNHEAPAGLRYLVTAYGELLGAVGTRVYFTRGVGNPNYWPEAYFINMPRAVTGLGVTDNGIIVFNQYKAYIITGTTPTTFIQYPLRGDQGCIDNRSIVQYDGAVLFASTDGICMSSGGPIQLISRNKLGRLGTIPTDATIHDEVYYLQQSNGKTLATDFGYGGIFKQFDFGITGVSNFNDTLYGFLAGQLYELLVSSTDLAITYLSPTFTEGSFSTVKLYNNVYVRAIGDLQFTVFIDGVEVLVSTLATTIYHTHDLSVPQTKQRGYSISFRVTGTGTIKEIEYKTVSRQNGR